MMSKEQQKEYDRRYRGTRREERRRLKKAEHDARRYSEIYAGFKADVEDLLITSVKIEEARINAYEEYVIRDRHIYAKSLCETLLADLRIIERKYEE